MKTILLALAFVSPSAFAYTTGDYTCKSKNLDSTYSVSDLNVTGVELPYVVITRNFAEGTSAVIKGIATVSQTNNEEILTVGAAKLAFVNGSIPGCTKQ